MSNNQMNTFYSNSSTNASNSLQEVNALFSELDLQEYSWAAANEECACKNCWLTLAPTETYQLYPDETLPPCYACKSPHKLVYKNIATAAQSADA